jgi:transcriptional regulator with XRE-family HTH domain
MTDKLLPMAILRKWAVIPLAPLYLAKADHKADKARAQEMKAARKRAGLTQGQAAELLGLASFNTVARYESGLRSVSDIVYRAAMELYHRQAIARAGTVPRGTVMESSRSDRIWAKEEPAPETAEDAARRIRALTLRLEGDLVAAGGTDSDLEEWHEALKIDYHVRMFGSGYKPDYDMMRQYRNYTSAVRALTQTFIDRLELTRRELDDSGA